MLQGRLASPARAYLEALRGYPANRGEADGAAAFIRNTLKRVQEAGREVALRVIKAKVRRGRHLSGTLSSEIDRKNTAWAPCSTLLRVIEAKVCGRAGSRAVAPRDDLHKQSSRNIKASALGMCSLAHPDV